MEMMTYALIVNMLMSEIEQAHICILFIKCFFLSCFVMNFASLHQELYNWLNDMVTDNDAIRPIRF